MMDEVKSARLPSGGTERPVMTKWKLSIVATFAVLSTLICWTIDNMLIGDLKLNGYRWPIVLGMASVSVFYLLSMFFLINRKAWLKIMEIRLVSKQQGIAIMAMTIVGMYMISSNALHMSKPQLLLSWAAVLLGEVVSIAACWWHNRWQAE
jgi:hypothetical protein